MKLPVNKIICGDVKEVLPTFPGNCIDLIVTSPPYADCRKKSYGGIHPDKSELDIILSDEPTNIPQKRR